MALPKATVQLQPVPQPFGTTLGQSSLTTNDADDEDEVDDSDGGIVKILSGLGLIAALVVLTFQLMAANAWINADDAEPKGDWMKLVQ